jgi:protein-S-isoprenylcysteine O-methyltransferase Ste14
MNNKKMPLWGVGITFALISITYLVIVIIINTYTKPLFLIKQLPSAPATIAGISLLAIGIPFYILCGRTIHKVYNENILCTTGVYAVCRHPLYSSWIFFNVPGIVIFFRSWLLLTVPLFMYILLVILARKEENYLKNIFGNDYLEYKKKTNFAFPKLWKIFNK